ncbi:hypothetical protein U1Q18_044201 [Sarracenia purpurea var. burkii]
MRCQRKSKEDLSHRSRKFSEPQLRSWLALDRPPKCKKRSFTIESCHSLVPNRVRSRVTSLNDGWEGPKIIENFKTPVTLVKGVCGWMASFWGSETNRVREEASSLNAVRSKVMVGIDEGYLPDAGKTFKAPVSRMVFPLYQSVDNFRFFKNRLFADSPA